MKVTPVSLAHGDNSFSLCTYIGTHALTPQVTQAETVESVVWCALSLHFTTHYGYLSLSLPHHRSTAFEWMHDGSSTCI